MKVGVPMGQLFIVLGLVLLSGTALFTLSYLVNVENQRVPVKVRERRD